MTLRNLLKNSAVEVVAINDLTDNATLAHLFQYDSAQGRFDGTVEAGEDYISINGKKIKALTERNPAKLPWKDLQVDVVLECTGVFRTTEKAGLHLQAGAKKVVLSAPAKSDDIQTIVLGVNDIELDNSNDIFSNASCTTNCLAPLAKVLDEAFGLEEGFITTVHAYTNDQRLADVPHRSIRRSRAAAENIIPTTTGAARAVGIVLPHLQGRLDGIAMRVPVPDGSIVDLTCRVKGKPTTAEVNQAVAEAAAGPMQGVLEYSEVPLVSSDIIGNPHSSIFDALSTSAQGDGYLNVVSWYDNEWGYSNRVVDLIERVHAL